jgi:hypothetical protein
MTSATIDSLLEFLTRLRAARIYYALSDHTEDAVMVEISVPGERWEVEFHQDGQIGVEVFASKGKIEDAKLLDDLFSRFSD